MTTFSSPSLGRGSSKTKDSTRSRRAQLTWFYFVHLFICYFLCPHAISIHVAGLGNRSRSTLCCRWPQYNRHEHGHLNWFVHFSLKCVLMLMLRTQAWQGWGCSLWMRMRKRRWTMARSTWCRAWGWRWRPATPSTGAPSTGWNNWHFHFFPVGLKTIHPSHLPTSKQYRLHPSHHHHHPDCHWPPWSSWRWPLFRLEEKFEEKLHVLRYSSQVKSCCLPPCFYIID